MRTDEQMAELAADVRAQLAEPDLHLVGKVKDYGFRACLFPTLGDQELPAVVWINKGAGLDTADAAALVRDRINTARGVGPGLTDAERRAFTFGPAMRRLAQEHCGGSLPAALDRFSTEGRVQQHWGDVAAIRLEHRPTFLDLIQGAGGLDEDLGEA